jgi:hypothetical protein
VSFPLQRVLVHPRAQKYPSSAQRQVLAGGECAHSFRGCAFVEHRHKDDQRGRVDADEGRACTSLLIPSQRRVVVRRQGAETEGNWWRSWAKFMGTCGLSELKLSPTVCQRG